MDNLFVNGREKCYIEDKEPDQEHGMMIKGVVHIHAVNIRG